jgi:glycosyltransferase involved in cell wall biosynthesis
VRVADASVVTATFNSADVIERNIRSVGAQSTVPKEHLIVDDGSLDDTVAIVKRLRREFPHVQIIRQSNGGAGAARNTGIEAASGRYIAFLDSDDLWSEYKIEKQIGFMADHGYALSYGEYDIVDAGNGDLLGRHCSPDMVSYKDFLSGCPVGCLTIAYDQKMLGKRFMPEVRRGQDWGCWLELTRDGAIGYRYPGCHAIYRRHENSLSSDKFFKAVDIYRIYRDQEELGRFRTLGYMLPHVFGALSRRHFAAASKLVEHPEDNRAGRIVKEAGGIL